ncbi:MAG: hypothetical protein IKD04_05665 [Clostridia bacterium]|nr:hypothetical protein [Clostridia bacterium]
MKKLLAWICIFTLLFATNVSASSDIGNMQIETEIVDLSEKVYCNATIDENFVDDTVMVVLTKKFTDESFDKEFTLEDFSEIPAKSLEDMSTGAIAKIKLQREKDKVGEVFNTYNSEEMTEEAVLENALKKRRRINEENFQRILCIKLYKRA